MEDALFFDFPVIVHPVPDLIRDLSGSRIGERSRHEAQPTDEEVNGVGITRSAKQIWYEPS
jgi:hypothetical protein